MLTKTFDVQVIAVADQPLLTVPAELSFSEDQPALFSIATNLQDTDGSEMLAVVLSGVPAGATLSDGTQSFTATSGAGAVDVTAWNLASMEIALAEHSDEDFELTVSVTATEGANLDQALAVETILGPRDGRRGRAVTDRAHRNYGVTKTRRAAFFP